MKINKNKLLEFIRKTVPSCLEIVSCHVNDYDGTGDDGEPCFAGENIIVECLVECPDPNYPISNLYGRKKRMIQVKAKQFQHYLEKVEAVKIIS